MGWLVAIVVLVAVIAFEGFRKFMLGLLALGVLGGGIAYYINKHEEKLSRSRISLAELVFENVDLRPDYSAYKLSGRVKNISQQYTLRSIRVRVTMRDCMEVSGKRDCVIIGEHDEDIRLTIPPGQARDFDDSVYLSRTNLQPKGSLLWDYSVVEIEAKSR